MRVTNNSGIPLALAVWLLHDDYDYIDDPNYVSVTRLMRPLRQIIIPGRIPAQERANPDLDEFIARALGNSLHNSIELAWNTNYPRALKLLGYPDDVINKIAVNPSESFLKAHPGCIPVYLEQRAFREFNGKKIGGKYDMVTEGIVNDTKSTSAFAWVNGTRDEEHQLQGSLYRWIDAAQEYPKITEEYMRVNYIFTDWQKSAARSNPKYPQKRLEYKDIPLLSLNQTEDWLRHKLDQIAKFVRTPEFELPECTDEELWRSAPQYKYYADPTKTDGKSTKNFDSLAEANSHQYEKGKGIVITKLSEPKRCGYCDAYSACSQKDKYFS